MPDPVLRIDLLGAPVFHRLGRPVVVDTRKALAVLAMVAVALADGAGPVGRERLAAMFWPEVDDVHARGALRRTLSVLGTAAGDAVLSTRSTVGLNPDAVLADVVEFRRLATSADVEDLARAVGLVRADFLAGFAVRGCAAFEDWTEQTAGSLRREFGTVLERLVGARVHRGELAAALAAAQRWLELDPLHEPAHRSVLRLLAWTGRRQDAIEHYSRCVRVLGDELGVAPVQATTRLYLAIRTDTLAPPRPGTRVLPGPRAVPAVPELPPVLDVAVLDVPMPDVPMPDVPMAQGAAELPMVGRDAALAALLAVAPGPRRGEGAGVPGTPGDTGATVVVLTGESGVGRSRLVEEFAARAAPVLLARAHGGEAALSFAPIADLVRGAAARVGDLDPDLAVDLSRIVAECRPAGRGPASPLDSPGARDRFFDAVVRVLAAARVRAVVVEDVHATNTASAEVLAYLLYRLDRLGCPLVLTWRDPGLPARHPVGMALASGRLAGRVREVTLGRLRADDVATLLTRSGSSLDPQVVWSQTAGLAILVAGLVRSGGEALPGTLRDLLAGRLAEVSEEAGQVLGALAVLGGVAEPGLLRATSGRGEIETVEAVEEALGAGLVREEGAAVAFPHDALRRVADDQLSRVRRRLLHARAAEALGAGSELPGRAGRIAHHWHEAGRDDLAVVWAWTAATRAIGLFAHEETLLHLESVVAFGRDDAEVALAAGDALVALARYDEALVAFRRAASLADGDGVVRAAVERRAADVHARTGEWALAASGLEAAGTLLAAQGERGLLAQVLADRVVVAVRAGDPVAADRYCAAALASDAEAAPSAYVRNASGLVALAAGDPAGAVTAFETALATGPEVVLRAAVLNNLARARAAAGAPTAALATAREALALGRTHGDRHRLAALHANLADRLHEAGEAAAAMSELKAAAALFAEVGSDALGQPDVWTLTSW